MKAQSRSIAVWLAFSLTSSVHAQGTLTADTDPFALPIFSDTLPADVNFTVLAWDGSYSDYYPISAVLLNQVSIGQPVLTGTLNFGTVYSPMGSSLTISLPFQNPTFTLESWTPISPVFSYFGGLESQTPQVLIPEPNESSLLLFGLAVIAAILRFSPRKA